MRIRRWQIFAEWPPPYPARQPVGTPYWTWRGAMNSMKRLDRLRRIGGGEWRYILSREAPSDGESTEAWEARMIKDGQGADAEHVALAFNCLPRMVRKIRVRHKREPERGLLAEGLSMADLAAEGYSARQIIAILAKPEKAGLAQYYVNRSRKAA